MFGYRGKGSIAFTNIVHRDSGVSDCMIKKHSEANIIHSVSVCG
jgi:hypothetical protein